RQVEHKPAVLFQFRIHFFQKLQALLSNGELDFSSVLRVGTSFDKSFCNQPVTEPGDVRILIEHDLFYFPTTGRFSFPPPQNAEYIVLLMRDVELFEYL